MTKGDYFVYILASKTKVLYIGITNNLENRLFDHKNKTNEGFTSKYNVNRLVYYEEYDSAYEAICREKQLKNWKRQWKINLIESINPFWDDPSDQWRDP